MLLINKLMQHFHGFKYRFDNVSINNNLYFMDDPRFQEIYSEAKLRLAFDPDIPLRVHQALWCANNALSVEGDFIELGVGKGFIFYNILSHIGGLCDQKKIYLCDTFVAFKVDNNGRQLPQNGVSKLYAPSFDVIENRFKAWPNVRLVEGVLPESLKALNREINSISFLHVDLNHHRAEVDCLEYLWPKLSSGAFILLDDFGNPGREAQMKAHLDFFSGKQQPILSLATGQGLVIKR